jgi:hypothetical protein
LGRSLCRVGIARYRAIPPQNRACEFPRTRLKPLQSPLLQGPALQRRTGSMKLTMAIRVQQVQISVVVCTAFTLGDAMVDVPPRLLGDQLVRVGHIAYNACSGSTKDRKSFAFPFMSPCIFRPSRSSKSNPYPSHYRIAFAFSALLDPQTHRHSLRSACPCGQDYGLTLFPPSDTSGLDLAYTPVASCQRIPNS